MFENFNPKAKITLHPETVNVHDKVERYGYIPMARRIRAMLEAGDNLAAIRTEMCDFPAGEEIDWSKPFDPVLSKDFDKFQEMQTLEAMREKYDKLIALQAKQKLLKELVDEGVISIAEEKKEIKEDTEKVEEKNQD